MPYGVNLMKIIKLVLLSLTLLAAETGFTAEKLVPVDSVQQIKNFHFVSDRLASSGQLHLDDYQHIKQYGFKHVVNLIPGEQTKERARVESLGLSYQQIEVDWNKPTMQDFATFVELMEGYQNNKVYVRCKLNWRASTFVYLYQVTQAGVDKQQAIKDLHKIWKPSDSWQSYINKVEMAYSK